MRLLLICLFLLMALNWHGQAYAIPKTVCICEVQGKDNLRCYDRGTYNISGNKYEKLILDVDPPYKHWKKIPSRCVPPADPCLVRRTFEQNSDISSGNSSPYVYQRKWSQRRCAPEKASGYMQTDTGEAWKEVLKGTLTSTGQLQSNADDKVSKSVKSIWDQVHVRNGIDIAIDRLKGDYYFTSALNNRMMGQIDAAAKQAGLTRAELAEKTADIVTDFQLGYQVRSQQMVSNALQSLFTDPAYSWTRPSALMHNFADSISYAKSLQPGEIATLSTAFHNFAKMTEQTEAAAISEIKKENGDIRNAVNTGSTGGSLYSPAPYAGDRSLSCFAAGTKISMADGGFKPIEDVKIGDMVLSFAVQDARNARPEAKEVTDTIQHGKRTVYLLNGSIKVTPEHRFVDSKSGEFKPISEFEMGESITDSDGKPVKVKSLQKLEGAHTVYNFTVDGHHTYIAGGMRVHNWK